MALKSTIKKCCWCRNCYLQWSAALLEKCSSSSKTMNHPHCARDTVRLLCRKKPRSLIVICVAFQHYWHFINRKSYMSFRLVPKSVTLNDLERRNGPYFALFQRFRVRCCRKILCSVVRAMIIQYTCIDYHILSCCLSEIQAAIEDNKRQFSKSSTFFGEALLRSGERVLHFTR